MTSSQVECFFAAAEYKSFTKAAQHLYMTTAAVSKNIHIISSDIEINSIISVRALDSIKERQVKNLWCLAKEPVISL